MRTLADRLIARIRRAETADGGFTLIEMVVSLLIFALAAQALAGVLISGATAEAFARNTTVAKGLTQQRIDAMRSLPFHVDAQNGPFVDVLDLYFPNASSSTYYVPLPDLLPGDKAPGSYVATAPGTSPAAPYYKITIPGDYLGSKYAHYTQTVYTQFLYANNPAATPLPASAIPATYNNGVIGADEPVSPLIGVTVVTSWSSGGTSHASTTFTEIASEGTDTNLVVAQAKAAGVLVQTQDHALNTITVTLGGVTVNGSLSNGSQSGGTAVGASIVDTDPTLASPSITGAQAAAAAPANPGPFSQSASGTSIGSGGPCGGWGEFGPTRVADVSASVASGLPSSPTDANLGGAMTGTLNAANSGGGCAGMWFSNQVDSAASPNADLGFSSSEPMVRVADTSGSSATVTGAGAVFTGAATGAGGAVTATASSSMATWLKVFPGLPFVTGTPSLPAGFPSLTGTPGLVNVYLTSAQLSCVSADAVGDTSASLSYSGYVVWYTYDTNIGSGVWIAKPFSWSSASPGTDPLAVVDVTQPVKENADGTTTPLSAYITSIAGATSITGDNGGLKSIDAAVSVGTVPTLVDSSDVPIPGTTIGVELGQLSCIAQDNRS